MPEDFHRITWYDLSPMRPDDYARQEVFRWREAVACRNAYEQGVQDAARERETHDRLMAEEMQA